MKEKKFSGTVRDIFSTEMTSACRSGALDVEDAVGQKVKRSIDDVYSLAHNQTEHIKADDAVNNIIGEATGAGFEYGFKKAMNVMLDCLIGGESA